MNTGHLFAGAGGGLLADLILGHKPIEDLSHTIHFDDVWDEDNKNAKID